MINSFIISQIDFNQRQGEQNIYSNLGFNSPGAAMKRLLAGLAIAIAFLAAPLSLCAAADPMASKDPQDHTRTLEGRVLNRQDDPLQKAIVYLKNTKSLTVKTYITDSDGGYRFPALSPNVDYEVYAEFNGARSDTKTLSSFDNRKLVNITLRIK